MEGASVLVVQESMLEQSRLLGRSSLSKELVLVGHLVFAISHSGTSCLDLRDKTWFLFAHNGVFEYKKSVNVHLVRDKIYCVGLILQNTTFTHSVMHVTVMDVLTGEWEEVTPRAFSKVFTEGHASVYFEERDQIVVSGSTFELATVMRVQVFDVRGLCWFVPRIEGRRPLEREYHSACAAGSVMYIYAGRDSVHGQPLHDLHALDFSKSQLRWEEIQCNNSPSPRMKASLVPLPSGKLLIVGGVVFLTRHVYDLHVIELPRCREENATAFDVTEELTIQGVLDESNKYYLTGDEMTFTGTVKVVPLADKLLVFGGHNSELSAKYFEMKIQPVS